VSFVAPLVTASAYSKVEQFIAEQVVTAPPTEYVPIAHSVQSVAVVAPVISAIEPAVQLLAVQVVTAPPKEYVP